MDKLEQEIERLRAAAAVKTTIEMLKENQTSQPVIPLTDEQREKRIALALRNGAAKKVIDLIDCDYWFWTLTENLYVFERDSPEWLEAAACDLVIDFIQLKKVEQSALNYSGQDDYLCMDEMKTQRLAMLQTFFESAEVMSDILQAIENHKIIPVVVVKAEHISKAEIIAPPVTPPVRVEPQQPPKRTQEELDAELQDWLIQRRRLSPDYREDGSEII